jgi:predicted nucleic acid-binding protein
VILVDTSVWIDHLHLPDPVLALAIAEDRVIHHPFVTAELALGSLPRRSELLETLAFLPSAVVVELDEFLDFVETRRLFATGLGMVDAHLLASASAVAGTRLWTRDKRLAEQAARLHLAAFPLGSSGG